MKNLISANSNGEVNYGLNVLQSIVQLATQEISGVSSLVNRIVRPAQGGKVDVDVSINVYYGTSCSSVAFRVQNNIKKNIETSTSFKAGVVNVNILGVEFIKEEKTIL